MSISSVYFCPYVSVIQPVIVPDYIWGHCCVQHPLLFCLVSSLYGYHSISHLMIVFGPSLVVRVVSGEKVMSVSG